MLKNVIRLTENKGKKKKSNSGLLHKTWRIKKSRRNEVFEKALEPRSPEIKMKSLSSVPSTVWL